MVALSSYAGSVADRLRVNEAEQEIKMKQLLSALTIIIGLIVAGIVHSGEVKIVNVEVSCSSSCMFSVTLKHGDEGWEHYANQWDVMTMDGKLLKPTNGT